MRKRGRKGAKEEREKWKMERVRKERMTGGEERKGDKSEKIRCWKGKGGKKVRRKQKLVSEWVGEGW